MAGSMTVAATESVNRSMLLLQLGIALHECAVEPAVLVLASSDRKLLVRIKLSPISPTNATLLDRLRGITGVEAVEEGPWKLTDLEASGLLS